MKKKWSWFSTLFLAPAFLSYTILIIVPVFYSIYYSFTKWNGGGAPVFLGFDNYIRLFSDESYWKVVGNTMTLAFFTVVFQVSLGLIFAYLLFQTLNGFRFFRMVYFMPVVVAPVTIGIMFAMFYNSDLGPLNKLLAAIGLSFLQHNWLSDLNVVLYSVITPQVWQYIGLFAVILLAGLRSIPNEVFESAKIDGASSWRIFFSIVIPLLSEFIGICVILAVTGSLKSFDHSWVITAGGPGSASSYIATLMYKTAFRNFQFGYASAITLTILVYAVTFTVIFKKFLSRYETEY
ncbi:MAG: sugar ABC transporter permease [Anaerolineaceae bacterium]|nr:sugar ABC transporter permease [Anaerolineaceae bacterium]